MSRVFFFRGGEEILKYDGVTLNAGRGLNPASGIFLAPQVPLQNKINAMIIKGIVSRDFQSLQMILMDRIGVPDVPLEVYYFLNFRFHIVF